MKKYKPTPGIRPFKDYAGMPLTDYTASIIGIKWPKFGMLDLSKNSGFSIKNFTKAQSFNFARSVSFFDCSLGLV